MDLAEQIIQNNSKPNTKTDDLGIPIPPEFSKNDYSPDYLVARVFLLHPQIYLYRTVLWEHGDIVREDTTTLASLARWPYTIPLPMQAVVWDRIRELAPHLDTSKVAIAPDTFFNIETGELEPIPPNTILV